MPDIPVAILFSLLSKGIPSNLEHLGRSSPAGIAAFTLPPRWHGWRKQYVVFRQKAATHAAVLRAAWVGRDFACRLHGAQVRQARLSRRDSQNRHLTHLLAALQPCSAGAWCPLWHGRSFVCRPALLAARLVGSLICWRRACLSGNARISFEM